jgi:hypothetical protein
VSKESALMVLFICIGQEWEDAWDTYLREWLSPCGSSWVLCTGSSNFVARMNLDKFNQAYHEWSDDHFVACTVEASIFEDVTNYIFLTETAPTDFFDAMNLQLTESYEGIGHDHEGFALARFMRDQPYQPCLILSASRPSNEFSVLRLSLLSQRQRGLLKVEKLPAKGLRFLERPLKSDIFHPKAFRHEILIPDESFPALWRDLE